MKKIRIALIFFTTLFIFSCISHKKNAQFEKEIKSVLTAKIDSLLETENPRPFNGVVLITLKGKTIYSKELGFSNFEDKIPISLKDRFRMMSNNKEITAALILREVQKGNIELHEPIKRYFPNSKKAWFNKVTVHQLLNMSSGVVYDSNDSKSLLFEPGKGFLDNIAGYELLGTIIEKVTGKEYSQLANSLFKEVGMNNSYCYEIGQNRNRPINGYWRANGEHQPVEFDSIWNSKETWKDFVPAIGTISTAADIDIYNSKLYQGNIINSKLLESMFTSSNRGKTIFENDSIGYGYGLRIYDKHPILHFANEGRGNGFVSSKFYFPSKKINVIVLENTDRKDSNFYYGTVRYHFANEIRRIMLKNNQINKNYH